MYYSTIKKLALLLIVIISFSNNIFNQNLLPNGSFETYTSLPNYFGQINKSWEWSSPDSITRADFFYKLPYPAKYPGIIDIPNVYFDKRWAYNDTNQKAFAGFYVFDGNDHSMPWKEWVSTNTTQRLKDRAVYHVCFKVSLAYPFSTAAVRKIGALFSDSTLKVRNYVFYDGANPVSFIEGENFVVSDYMLTESSDTNGNGGWMTIEGDIITPRNSAYRYVYFGNFQEPVPAVDIFEFRPIHPYFQKSYYFIDSATVTFDHDLPCLNEYQLDDYIVTITRLENPSGNIPPDYCCWEIRIKNNVTDRHKCGIYGWKVDLDGTDFDDEWRDSSLTPLETDMEWVRQICLDRDETPDPLLFKVKLLDQNGNSIPELYREIWGKCNCYCPEIDSLLPGKGEYYFDIQLVPVGDIFGGSCCYDITVINNTKCYINMESVRFYYTSVNNNFNLLNVSGLNNWTREPQNDSVMYEIKFFDLVNPAADKYLAPGTHTVGRICATGMFNISHNYKMKVTFANGDMCGRDWQGTLFCECCNNIDASISSDPNPIPGNCCFFVNGSIGEDNHCVESVEIVEIYDNEVIDKRNEIIDSNTFTVRYCGNSGSYRFILNFKNIHGQVVCSRMLLHECSAVMCDALVNYSITKIPSAYDDKCCFTIKGQLDSTLRYNYSVEILELVDSQWVNDGLSYAVDQSGNFSTNKCRDFGKHKFRILLRNLNTGEFDCIKELEYECDNCCYDIGVSAERNAESLTDCCYNITFNSKENACDVHGFTCTGHPELGPDVIYINPVNLNEYLYNYCPADSAEVLEFIFWGRYGEEVCRQYVTLTCVCNSINLNFEESPGSCETSKCRLHITGNTTLPIGDGIEPEYIIESQKPDGSWEQKGQGNLDEGNIDYFYDLNFYEERIRVVFFKEGQRLCEKEYLAHCDMCDQMTLQITLEQLIRKCTGNVLILTNNVPCATLVEIERINTENGVVTMMVNNGPITNSLFNYSFDLPNGDYILIVKVKDAQGRILCMKSEQMSCHKSVIGCDSDIDVFTRIDDSTQREPGLCCKDIVVSQPDLYYECGIYGIEIIDIGHDSMLIYSEFMPNMGRPMILPQSDGSKLTSLCRPQLEYLNLDVNFYDRDYVMFLTKHIEEICEGDSVGNDLIMSLNTVPNPANESTTSTFELAAACNISLKLYNQFGQFIAEYENGYRQAGSYSVEIPTQELTNGIYNIVLKANNEYKSIILVVIH